MGQRLRKRYVNSILRQEVGWFDTCGAADLGTLVADLSGKVEEGTTQKVGQLFQYTSQFFVSIIAALYLKWNLALVLIATFPLIAGAGAFMITAVASAQNETSEQYAKAGGLASKLIDYNLIFKKSMYE